MKKTNKSQLNIKNEKNKDEWIEMRDKLYSDYKTALIKDDTILLYKTELRTLKQVLNAIDSQFKDLGYYTVIYLENLTGAWYNRIEYTNKEWR
jgi:hypothetical protein